jgi:hypothetical protein
LEAAHAMSPAPIVTPREALLRVLIAGESDGSEIVRKVRDWTEGQVQLDDEALGALLAGLEQTALIERHAGAVDKRTGQARPTFALTAAGRSEAMEILAASLTRKA